jgi:hypothetical protein
MTGVVATSPSAPSRSPSSWTAAATSVEPDRHRQRPVLAAFVGPHAGFAQPVPLRSLPRDSGAANPYPERPVGLSGAERSSLSTPVASRLVPRTIRLDSPRSSTRTRLGTSPFGCLGMLDTGARSTLRTHLGGRLEGREPSRGDRPSPRGPHGRAPPLSRSQDRRSTSSGGRASTHGRSGVRPSLVVRLARTRPRRPHRGAFTPSHGRARNRPRSARGPPHPGPQRRAPGRHVESSWMARGADRSRASHRSGRRTG